MINKLLKDNKNKKVLLVMSIIIGFTIVFAISYAFLGPFTSNATNTGIDLNASAVDSLTFVSGDPIILSPGSHNLNDTMGNLVSNTSVSSAKYNSGDQGVTKTQNYNVYFVIDKNTFVYSDGSTPELILTVTKPDGTVLDDLTGYNYITNGEVSGFDVTTTTGIVEIALNHAITTDHTEVVQDWSFTLTMLNLPFDQSSNANAVFSSSVLLQKLEFKYPEIASYLIANHDESNGLIQHTPELANGAGDNNYRYSGSNDVVSNNWVCFGSDAVICPEENKYRIIGIYDGNVKLIKATAIDKDGDGILEITFNGEDTFVWDADNSNDYETSDIKNYLNGEFYNAVPTNYQAMIKESAWNVGENNTSNETAYEFYRDTIGSPIVNKTSTGKIGLMYASDYGYAAHKEAWITDLAEYNSQTIKDNNWLFNLENSQREWTIVPNSSDSRYVWTVNYNGIVNYSVTDFGFASRPVFYLESSAKILSGTGSEVEPFRIRM